MLLSSLILFACIFYTHASVTDYITPLDKEKFKEVLQAAHNDPSFFNMYYLAKGLTVLKEEIPKTTRTDVCDYLHSHFKNDLTSEEIFYAISSWSLIKCDDKDTLQAIKRSSANLHTDDTVKALKAALDQTEVNTTNIRYCLESLTLLKHPIPSANKIANILESSLKKDENFISIGHALHAASLLGASGTFALPYIEDILAQADEIDGRMLQWDGGLTTTGLLLSGILRLPGVKPITRQQADKLAAYLLTRKTVKTPKGVISLLDSVFALINTEVSPLSIGFIGSSQVVGASSNLRIRVSDIMGQPLKPAPSTVVAQSATRVTDDVVIVSKQPLTTTKNPVEFVLVLVKVQPGQYRLSITAGSDSASLIFRVLDTVTLNWLEAGLGDADGTSAPRLTKLNHPSTLSSILQADSSQHLIVRFSLSQPVHQAFLRLSAGKREIIFVAEQDSTKAYKIDVNLGLELTYSAVFDMELILGDSFISNPLRWTFGKVDVKLTTTETKQPLLKGPRPEIKHMFRPAEKRPPQLVSMLFTVLAAAPLLLLLILWLALGINLKNFTISASLFHVGLAGIFGLFTLFWLKLDMFTTCGWLMPIGIFTLLAGHHALSKLVKHKKV